jgi:plastocyanin
MAGEPARVKVATPSSTGVLLAALVVVGALAVALLVWVPGRSAPRTVGETAADGKAQGTAAVQPAIRGNGTIAGEVLFLGNPPTMHPLKLGADPVCAGGSRFDEQVIVSNGRLANVFVRLLGAPPEQPPSVPAIVDQRSCVFRPRVQGIIRGQSVEIRNGDPTLHNAHAYAGGWTLFNYAQPAGAPPVGRPLTDRSGVLKLKCDVHPWMTAFIHVVDNSYFAVTGADGSFSIRGLAEGSYELEAWHERFGVKRAKVDLREGETAQTAHLTFSYSPDDRG